VLLATLSRITGAFDRIERFGTHQHVQRVSNTSSPLHFQANERPLDRAHHAQGWGSAYSKAMKSGKDAKAAKYTNAYEGKATKVFKNDAKSAKAESSNGHGHDAEPPSDDSWGSASLDASGEPVDVATQSLGAPELFDGHGHHAAAASRGVGCVKKALAADYLLDRVSSYIDSDSLFCIHL